MTMRSHSLLPLGLAVCAACGARGRAGVPAPETGPVPPPRAIRPAVTAVGDSCVVGSFAAGSDTAAAWTVGVPGALSPADAPAPRSAAERFAFDQVYETLVRVDCRGRVEPALAARWQADATGRVWSFTLRPDARFADGVPVTAADVVVSWEARTVEGPWAGGIDSAVSAVGPRELIVRLNRAVGTAPTLFAAARYAVARPADAGGWPVGTGPFALEGAGDSALLVPVRPGWSPRLLVVRMDDARDAVDRGAVLAVTRDLGAVTYAATRGGYDDVALPWDTMYALATNGGWPATFHDAGLVDAVHADARPAVAPEWWDDLPACDPARDSARGGRSARNDAIYYRAGDPTARDLAARLVALAARRGTTALSLDPADFDHALDVADGGAFVMALPRSTGDPCTTAAHRLPFGWTLTPLIDVRHDALVRIDSGRWRVGADGALRFVAADGDR